MMHEGAGRGQFATVRKPTTDASKVLILGRAAREATMHRKNEFTIDGSHAGPGKDYIQGDAKYRQTDRQTDRQRDMVQQNIQGENTTYQMINPLLKNISPTQYNKVSL